MYYLPCDEQEQEREDLKFNMYLQIVDGKVVLAPIDDHPQKILDVGTGVGLWAIHGKFRDWRAGARSRSKLTTLCSREPLSQCSREGHRTLGCEVRIGCAKHRVVRDDIEDPEWLRGDNYDLVHYKDVLSLLKRPEDSLRRTYE